MFLPVTFESPEPGRDKKAQLSDERVLYIGFLFYFSQNGGSALNKVRVTFHVLLWFFAGAMAQPGGQLIEQSLDLFVPFTVIQYSTKQGLPENQVLDMALQKNGRLIVLTANGIVEYNGTEFKPFLTNTDYKVRQYHKLLWHEESGSLFACEMDGTHHLLQPSYKPLGDYVASTFVNDSMYCINYNGEIFGADVKQLNFKKIWDTRITDPRAMVAGSGSFLISTPKCLYRFYPELDGYAKKILDEGGFSFKLSQFNNLLHAYNAHHIYKVTDSAAVMLADISQYKNKPVCTAVAFTDTMEFFIGTNEGLYSFQDGYVDFYDEESAMPSKIILSLQYVESANCLMVGTREKGLVKLNHKECNTFDGKKVLKAGGSVASVIRTQKGEILLVENGGNLYKLNLTAIEPYSSEEGYYASLSEINDTLYIGTWGGGIKLLHNKKLVKRLNAPVSLPGNQVHAVFYDSRGVIWVGAGKGISRGTHSGNIKPLQGVLPENVIAISFYELKNGNLCVGANGQFFILDPNGRLLKTVGKAQGLGGREARSFYEDKKGRIWVGTYGGGLYCYDNNKLTNINRMKNAMLSADAFCLAPDNYGYLYITSNNGLWRIRETELQEFYEGKRNYLIPFHFSEENGILNTEFNGGFQKNYLKARAGHIFFPSLRGLVMVDPQQPRPTALHPEITRLLVNDSLHPFAQNQLQRNTYSMQFHFSCVNYSEKNNIYYQYRLNGSEKKDWSALQKEHSVTFKMLPPGTYTFSVRAIDAFNNPHPMAASYTFTIEPAFTETLQFKLGLAIVFVVLTSVIIRTRVRTLRKKAEEKERIRRQLAELELRAVQSQMNPHFIFNSLNSIKYYLSVKDHGRADFYLDHFSKLLRDFLDAGSVNFIRLEKEMQILTSYLELEKNRVNPAFDFTITIDRGLENALIPTHLMQPLVENAVKHGINHSKEKCQLIIRCNRSDNYLCIVIRDNGVGRKKAEEINKNNKHVSKGLNMVWEKIRIVKELYNLDVQLEIEDKYSDEGLPAGTRVQLKLPLVYDKSSIG